MILDSVHLLARCCCAVLVVFLMVTESSASEPLERFGLSFVCGEQPNLDGFVDIHELGTRATGGENREGSLLTSLTVFVQPRNILSYRAIVLGFDNSCYISIEYVAPDRVLASRPFSLEYRDLGSFSYRENSLGLYVHLCVGESTEIHGGFRYVDVSDWPEILNATSDPPMSEDCRNDLEETFLDGIHLELPDLSTVIFRHMSIYPSGLLVVGGTEDIIGDVQLVEE